MMKIRVSSGKYRIVIPVPYFVIDNPLSMLAIHKKLREDETQIDPEIAVKCIKAFSKMRKQYKGLELVRIETSDGQFVQIVL